MVTYAFRVLLVSLFLSFTISALPTPEPADATFNITALETEFNQLIDAGLDTFDEIFDFAGANMRRASSDLMADAGSSTASGNFTFDEAIKQGLIELVGGEVQAANGFGDVIETLLGRRSPAPEGQGAGTINFTEITEGIEDVIQGIVGDALGGGLKRRSDEHLTSNTYMKRTINITAIEQGFQQEFQQFVQALEGFIGAFIGTTTGAGLGGGIPGLPTSISIPGLPTSIGIPGLPTSISIPGLPTSASIPSTPIPTLIARDSDSLTKFPEFDNGVAEVIDGALEVTAAALGF